MLDKEFISDHITSVGGSHREWQEEGGPLHYKGLRHVYFMEEAEMKIRDPSKLWYVMGMPSFSNFVTREDGDKTLSWMWVPAGQNAKDDFFHAREKLKACEALKTAPT